MEKLSSVLKNQQLRLALKALTLAYGVAISYGDVQLSLLTAGLAVWFYFRPTLNLDRFWVAYSINLILAFMVPYDSVGEGLSLLLLGIFTLITFAILGIKNLIFIKRSLIYQIIVLVLISELTLFYFAGFLGAWGVLLAVILFLALITDYYRRINEKTSVIYPLVATFVYSQLLWAVSILPLSHFVKSTILITAFLLGNDMVVHKLSGNLTRDIIIRSGIIFVLISLVIFAVSNVPLE